jgi:hypothetical protein
VQRKLQQYCYCWPIYVGGPDTYRWGWAFNSLLGALWLQMSWVMVSTARRCAWCGKIVDLEDNQQEQVVVATQHDHEGKKRRRTRSDKRFCDNNGRCRASWNYHHGTRTSSKHARKKERESIRNNVKNSRP